MRTVQIGPKRVGEEEPCFIVFECGATFDSFAGAKKLIDAVAESGADAIKFQLMDADRLMGQRDLTISYTTAQGPRIGNIYEILKKRELTRDQWGELIRYCQEKGVIFIATACFPEEVDFLVQAGTAAIKINAGDVNHYYLIDYASKKGIPIILDGRAKYDELEQGVQICERNGNKNIIIMHCPSGYPARNDGVNLTTLASLKKIYQYPIGFSDHSREKLMNFPAIVYGADVVEKTLTLDKNTDFIEHLMSLEPHEAKEFVQEIRAIEEAKGVPRIMFSKQVNEAGRRSIVAVRNIRQGAALTIDDLEFKRPGDAGISAAEYQKVCQSTAKRDIAKDSFLQWEWLG